MLHLPYFLLLIRFCTANTAIAHNTLLTRMRRAGGLGGGGGLEHSPIVKLKVEDTECPLQVCQLSRSSESTHFRFLRRDVVLFVSTRALGQLLRSEARASDLLPNFPEYKTPTISYETHPHDLKFGYLQAFEAVS